MIHRPTINREQGFTLLEVLIALLVLSIGLLGLAALQTTGLRANQMATMRTMAMHMAYDMSDRMRANPQGTDDGDYVIDIATGATIVTDCSTADCSTADLATYDLALWKGALGTLPGGLGEITQDAGPPVTHTITVHWDEDRKGLANPGTDCPPDDEDDLSCIELTI